MMRRFDSPALWALALIALAACGLAFVIFR